MLVAQVILFFCPKLISLKISAFSPTYTSVRFSMYGPNLFSLILRSLLLTSSKSLIFSMYSSKIEILSLYSMDSVDFSIVENNFSIYVLIKCTIRGMIPFASLSLMSYPCIVCVLPELVWPYAIIVPLNPSRMFCSTGRPTC
jgi:hypothetical protein